MSVSIGEQKFLTFNVGHAVHDVDWNRIDVSCFFVRVYWVTKGIASVSIAGNEHVLHPNHQYLISPFAIHLATMLEILCHEY